MKIFVISSLIALSSLANAAEWKVVAETENCHEKAQVLAKDGEKYVVVKHGETSEKLFAEDGATFKADSMSNVVFSSPNYAFTQPSVVEGNPAKFDIRSGKKTHCRMTSR